MTARAVAAARRMEQAGLSDLVAGRVAVAAEIKEQKAQLAKLNAQIMKIMAKAGELSVNVGEVKVTMIVDAEYESFDRPGFMRYLMEHKVSPKLVAEAEEACTERKPKAPHLRVSGGE